MQAPPPFPFWPLSSPRPARILGMTFESKELQSLPAFQEALSARGRDFVSVRDNEPASLLLDLSNASVPGLLKSVVKDWGLLFSLWKAADAYLESAGERRQDRKSVV